MRCECGNPRGLRLAAMLVCMAVLLAGCATLQPSRQQASQAAQRVVSAYNVSDLLARADMVLTRSLLDSLPDDVDAAQRERLRQIIASHFKAAALTSAVQRDLAAQAVQKQHMRSLVDAADALDSPLAQRLQGLQAKVGNDGFATAYNTFIQQPPSARREVRLQQIKTLIHDMAIIELQSAFHVALLDTMLKTRNALAPLEQDMTLAEINQQLEQNRNMLRKQLHEQLPPILLFAYREVDDADFGKYVDLQGSEALLWTNRALARAIGKALEQAGAKVPAKAENL